MSISEQLAAINQDLRNLLATMHIDVDKYGINKSCRDAMKMFDDMRQIVTELEADNEQLRMEHDDAFKKTEEAQAFGKLRAEIKRLHEALIKYGRHSKAACTRPVEDCSYPFVRHVCDCGFTEALAEPKQDPCKECNGSGVYKYKYRAGSEECGYCEGTGKK